VSLPQATVTSARWSETPEVAAYMARYWDDAVGDCRQELVFIGVQTDEAGIRAAFDQALLTDGELELGPERWALFADSFPAWR